MDSRSYAHPIGWRVVAVAALLWALLLPSPRLYAQGPPDGGAVKPGDTLPGSSDTGALPDILKYATFDQNNGAQLPLALSFTNESGQAVTLGDYFANGKPTILTMNYYSCDTLCPLVLDGLVRGLNGVPFVMGQDFNVVTVGINPHETPSDAASVKGDLVARYGRTGAGSAWGLLTGDEATIAQLAEVAGVNFAYDEATQQYAHPSGVIVVTPDGHVSRYMFGVEFNPRDLRLALVDASKGTVGGVIDQVLLFCYHYDPTVGAYTPMVFNLMKLGGALTLLALALVLGPMIRKEIRGSKLLTTGVAD